MRGNLKATFIDGTEYIVPLQVVISHMVIEEMTTGDVCHDVAIENVNSCISKNPRIIIAHASKLDWEDVQDHAKLVGDTPSRLKKKFAWKNAEKHLVIIKGGNDE